MSRSVSPEPDLLYGAYPVQEFGMSVQGDESGAAVLRFKALEELCLTDALMLLDGSADLTGQKVWGGAYALARLLCDRPAMVKGKRVMEVGSGCAFVSLVAAFCGAKATLATDGDEDALALMRANVALNAALFGDASSKTAPTVEQLWWGKDKVAQPIDVVLGADVVYGVDAVQPLLATVKATLPAHGVFYLMHLPRALTQQTVDDALLAEAERVGLAVVVEPGSALPVGGPPKASCEEEWPHIKLITMRHRA